VVDPDTDVQPGVDVHDRGRRAFAADVDADPDALPGREHGVADALLPGAGGEP